MAYHYRGRVSYKGQMIVPALVAPPHWWDGVRKAKYDGVVPHLVDALLDTGANISSISPALADMLGLESAASIGITSIDGESVKPVYRVGIRLMTDPSLTDTEDCYTMRAISVTESYGAPERIVVGMDVLTRGRLALEGVNYALQYREMWG